MKRIYITGIAGMLGSNIAYILREKYDICGVDKVLLNAKGVISEKFDMLDYKKLRENIVNLKPDYLIHTAALINVDFCEKNRSLAYKTNSEMTYVLSEICRDISCKMVYISTDAVFDGEDKKLYTEEDIANPINCYGETKLQGENDVIKNNHLVVRTNIYGFNIQNKNSFGEWIYKSLECGDTLKMFTDIYFSPILVNDLAEILIELLEKNKFGLYHICASGSISKYDFGKYVQQRFSIADGRICKSLSDEFDFDAKRAKNMGMSNEKVKKELGIEIPTPKESIEKFHKLYCSGYQKELQSWGIVQK